MKKMVRIAFAFCAISFWGISEGNAADWKYITEDDAGSIWYYDATTIKKISNDVVQVWFRMKNQRGIKEFEIVRKSVQEAKSLSEINCTTKETRDIYLIAYGFDGSVVISDSTNGPWHPAVPGTTGETNYDTFCNKTRKSKKK
jgi:hypothetical protein